MEKLVKANKAHQCEACNAEISKGETHRFGKGKSLVYDPNDKQIGFKYFQYRVHNYNCLAPFECQIGNHKFEFDYGMRGDERYLEAGFYCKDCGEYLKELPTMEEFQEMDLKNIEEKGYSNNNI